MFGKAGHQYRNEKKNILIENISKIHLGIAMARGYQPPRSVSVMLVSNSRSPREEVLGIFRTQVFLADA